MNRKSKQASVLALWVVSLALTAAGQQTVNNASLEGRVTDPSGAVIAGASVNVREIATGLTTTVATDAEGRYRFPYLRVGAYEIRVVDKKFAPATRLITLTVGGAFDLPIQLALESGQQNVTVTAEPTVIETARSQVAGTVTQTEVNNLPLNGRSFLDLTLLVPGVSPTSTATPSFSPKPLPSRGRVFRSTVNGIFPTVLSLTVSPPMTMPPG